MKQVLDDSTNNSQLPQLTYCEVVQLGECCEIIAGQSPPSSAYNSDGLGLPFFQGKTDFGLLYPEVRSWCNAPIKTVLPDDILISVRAPVGPTNLADTVACIGRGLSGIRVGPRVHYKFLLHYLRSIENKIADRASGSTFTAITVKSLKEVEIPLPSLAEQQRIAAILDAADAHRQKTKALLEKYDQLAQSIFLEMFGDPVTNERGWEKSKLGNLMTIVRGGSPRPIDQFLGGTIPWIKIGDGTKGGDIYLESTKEHIIEAGLNKTRLLPSGSLIFANCGVSLGFARIITFEGCIHDGWLAFTDFDEEVIDKIFLLKALNSITKYFRDTAPDGTQPNLNTSIMKDFEIIVPPIELQKQFAHSLELVEAQKTEAVKSHAKSESLFQSLLQGVFKGELT